MFPCSVYDEFADRIGVRSFICQKLATFEYELLLHSQKGLFLKHNILPGLVPHPPHCSCGPELDCTVTSQFGESLVAYWTLKCHSSFVNIFSKTGLIMRRVILMLCFNVHSLKNLDIYSVSSRIIFDAGYFMPIRLFYLNIGTILLYATVVRIIMSSKHLLHLMKEDSNKACSSLFFELSI